MKKTTMAIIISGCISLFMATSPAEAKIATNGVRLNGIGLNGIRLNGVGLNGQSLNGENLNGKSLNGMRSGDVGLDFTTISKRALTKTRR